MSTKALEYLRKNAMFHVSIIFPIERGTAEIIYAGDDGVFIKDSVSSAYMLTTEDEALAKKLLDDAGRRALFCVFQKPSADYLMEKFEYNNMTENFQAVYLSEKPVVVSPTDLDIRTLGTEWQDRLFEHYHDDVDYDYLGRRLRDRAIYGGFIGDELCGFVGSHEEGSIGILKVLEKYRRRGFAAVLEGHMINIFLEKGDLPFAQVNPSNEASLKLHKKLGFELSRERLYWLFD